MRLSVLICFATLLVGSLSLTQAEEVFVLKDGRTIAGTKKGESKAAYTVEVNAGTVSAQIQIQKSEVKSIQKPSDVKKWDASVQEDRSKTAVSEKLLIRAKRPLNEEVQKEQDAIRTARFERMKFLLRKAKQESKADAQKNVSEESRVEWGATPIPYNIDPTYWQFYGPYAHVDPERWKALIFLAGVLPE